MVYHSVIGNASLAPLLWTLALPAALATDLALARFKAGADGLEMLDFIREVTDADDLTPELHSVGT